MPWKETSTMDQRLEFIFHPLGVLDESTRKILPAEQWHQRE